jgi:3-oxoacyl-[acyl-carrier-protein] synthase-3
MTNVYITASGIFLPNHPINNDEIEHYLGKINGKASAAKSRILKQNGIKTRYYAINKSQQTTVSNAQMAANAINQAIANSNVLPQDIELLATGTTQGDHLVPGFASMVHGELDIGASELANFQSVCASGMMALKSAFSQIKAGEKNNAVCAGSELASRLFKSSRFEEQEVESLSFDTEFLRWMLSDGAGALVLQNEKSSKHLNLKIEWIDIKSQAHQFPTCMYAGTPDNKPENGKSWMDYPGFAAASSAGAINLKQDIRLLDKVMEIGVAHYFELIDKGMVKTDEIDWLCCHYSSKYFEQPIKDLLQKGGALIPDEKWFSNLTTKGNTGAASIYIMLEELMHSGRLKEGQTILCMVPESGRFISSYMKLTVVGQDKQVIKSNVRAVEAPELNIEDNETAQWLVRQLSQVWIDFETNLLTVPIVEKIHNGTLSLANYKLLLHDLRQQVIDGSQWISRAASNIDIELFELRSAFIKHTATEHKDYQMLERNYVALGEPIELIQTGRKNIGSSALSAYMFHRASSPNPVDLLGSMFIIEGIGKRLASYWGELIKDQLGLSDDQVSFFTYHGVADENHFHRLEEALNHPMMHRALAEKIVNTAKTTAMLYEMQLKELGNY